MENLILTTEAHNGRYVALKSFQDHIIVGVGNDPAAALKEAQEKGFKNPVILYVPEKEAVHIY
jgi:microcystin degradation protein MlrC